MVRNQRKRHLRRIAVVGLGYVGLPVAVAFGRSSPVIAFDLRPQRVAELRRGHDRTGEVAPEELRSTRVEYTRDPAALARADFFIVAVPTPLGECNHPDFSHLISASQIIGPRLRRGAIVVYESTVYPGATEEICVPVLERSSGLLCGRDFKVGYSPERINPGDKEHTLAGVTKIVAGMDAETLEIIAEVYGTVVKAGVYRAPDIRTAEAAKVIENTQRDLNIALINELAMLFHGMHIDTAEVLKAAGTKWNFLPFKPGLVGGHCIGVDPFYLTHKAEMIGYHPQVILAGRRINDGMGKYIAEQTVKALIAQKLRVRHARVGILGLTFKENVPDIRNSKVVDIVRELREYGVDVRVHDPAASAHESRVEYQIELCPARCLKGSDAIILAVAHAAFLRRGARWIRSLLRNPARGVLLDVKSALNPQDFADTMFWRL